VAHGNHPAYDKAHQLIADGAWTVDAESGIIHGRRGPFSGRNTWGYVQISVWDGGGYHGYVMAHRVIWEYVRGPIPDDGQEINHLNGVKHDNRLGNLELVTPSENVKHAHRTGLHSLKGSRNNHAKLTEQDIPSIRAALAAGETARQIAERYGVGKYAICKIRQGIRWQHVPL